MSPTGKLKDPVVWTIYDNLLLTGTNFTTVNEGEKHLHQGWLELPSRMDK